MPRSPIVDCHMHVYWPEKYPYPEGRGAKPKPGEVNADPGALLRRMDASGVTHALLVQPSAHENDNRAAMEAIAISKGRLRGIGGVEISATDEELIELKSKGIVGVRLNLYSFQNDVFERQGIEDFLDRCARNGVVVEVFATPPTWPKIIDKLRSCRAKLVIEHMGWPNIQEGVGQEGFQLLLTLPKDTDCAVKLSCAFRMSASGFPFPEVTPYVEKLLDVFGPDRCLWGSDWPMLRSGRDRPFDYDEELAALERWAPASQDRQRILWKTPARLFGFKDEG